MSEPHDDLFEIVLRKELHTREHLSVNVLTFSRDGKLLISGGDDEVVRVWDTESFECLQMIKKDDWGQITALTLIYADDASLEPALCVGSGRGTVSMIPMASDHGSFVQSQPISIAPFEFNDSVELQTYDPVYSRLAIASHSGDLKMFNLKQKSLSLLWTAAFGDAIPSGIFFMGTSHDSLLCLGLETSEICCREASTGDILWRKYVNGGIGSGALSEDGATLLIDNLKTGRFDLYSLPEVSFLQTLPPVSQRRFTKQCSFIAESQLAICGSDSNAITVVDLANNVLLHSLVGGKAEDMTQAVAVTPESKGRLLLAGACGGSIYVWEKIHTSPGGKRGDHCSKGTSQHKMNANERNQTNWLFLAIVILTYPNWSPFLYFIFFSVKDKIGFWTDLWDRNLRMDHNM